MRPRARKVDGRKWIAAYWAPKLESKAVLAFCLNDMALTAEGFGWAAKTTKANRSE